MPTTKKTAAKKVATKTVSDSLLKELKQPSLRDRYPRPDYKALHIAGLEIIKDLEQKVSDFSLTIRDLRHERDMLEDRMKDAVMNMKAIENRLEAPDRMKDVRLNVRALLTELTELDGKLSQSANSCGSSEVSQTPQNPVDAIFSIIYRHDPFVQNEILQNVLHQVNMLRKESIAETKSKHEAALKANAQFVDIVKE